MYVPFAPSWGVTSKRDRQHNNYFAATILQPALELFVSLFPTAITTTGYLVSRSVTCFEYSCFCDWCTGCFCDWCIRTLLLGCQAYSLIASFCFNSAVFFSAVSCAIANSYALLNVSSFSANSRRTVSHYSYDYI